MIHLKDINQQGKKLFKQQTDELQAVCDKALHNIGQSVTSALSTIKDITKSYKAINKDLGYLLPMSVTPAPAEEEGPRPTY